MTKQERQRNYNKTFTEKHPDYMKKRLNEKYRMSEEFREQAKYRQMKNYWKRQGYDYESYNMPDAWNVLEHLKDYIYSAEEVKITNQNGYYLFEVKTKIKE